jgi:23S rRNA (cytidine1920-2'-O)/16S rRNA (cytidine1409-2'-O)-methyltransferase
MARERLDVLLTGRGLAESREKAQRLIQAGQVTVDGQRETRAGHCFAPDAAIVLAAPPRFVSRGGEKLEGAFAAFGLDVAGKVCLDVGSSTGGFTDCLLQHGAARVYAVDVGKGQLHWKLRNDPRVVVREEFNARYLQPGDLPEKPAAAVVDVSFISLTKVLPAVIAALANDAVVVTLIKPQFEAGRAQIERGGVVRDPAVRAAVVEEIRRFGIGALGLAWIGFCESPLRGPAGNVEFLACWKKAGQAESADGGTE